ncbi:arginase family protein [Pseudotabrizicola sp. 4114]|uniref:arginase family protein n=1 Tax=Pseudotabrizicola sp. 4114 TaxID=2817731 RepID=UPI00285E0346|nr:arginase [Pseudorhodobacter sp. 4114]
MSNPEKTLRLVMPQWQGGNNPNAYFGSKMLAWLAPESSDKTVEVQIDAPDGRDAVSEGGINHRSALIRQLESADAIIRAESPDKIVVFGGDCLVSQAPFAYLNERYGGELGVLWLDAHPDIKTTGEYPNAHTMVLGNLLGEGDSQFSAYVKAPLKPTHIMFGGLRSDGLTGQETEVINRHNLKVSGAYELNASSDAVVEWIRVNKIRYLAIHFDLDVLDPAKFRSTYFAEPDPLVSPYEFFPEGKMNLQSIARVIEDAASHAELVGLGITEHLPWDAINLKALLAQLPILRN